MACKQHIHHTEQNSEAGLQENIGDEFFGSIFTLGRELEIRAALVRTCSTCYEVPCAD